MKKATKEEYKRARELRKSRMELQKISNSLFSEGYTEKPRSLSWVRYAVMSLEKKVGFLYIQGLTLQAITEKINIEGYRTKRTGTPTIGCVNHYVYKNELWKHRENKK